MTSSSGKSRKSSFLLRPSRRKRPLLFSFPKIAPLPQNRPTSPKSATKAPKTPQKDRFLENRLLRRSPQNRASGSIPRNSTSQRQSKIHSKSPIPRNPHLWAISRNRCRNARNATNASSPNGVQKAIARAKCFYREMRQKANFLRLITAFAAIGVAKCPKPMAK